MDHEKKIGYIENGYVIDHIPSGEVWRIVRLLGINKRSEGMVSLGDGLFSKRMGSKGILKIEGIKLLKKELNLIALVAENATICEIVDGKVKKKIGAEIPGVLEGIVLCPNKGCISNDEYQKIAPLIHYGAKTGFSCHYCSRDFGKDEIRFRGYE